jgi:hypothetical protein
MNDPMHTKLRFNHKTNVIKSSGTTVLGADDGAGVWLMLCMIASGVPGTYMFHRGEECGGIGSRGIAREYGSMLAEYKYAVAFDRKGTTDVITHQAMGRCCSDKFAQALCDLLDMGHMPDPTGIFTDTANYVNEIPECSNISIGYEGAHSYSESLDLTYLYALAERMIEVFADAPELPVVRDPFETDVYDYPAKYSVWDDLYSMDEEDVVNAPFSRLREMVRKDPDGATDLLITLSEKLVYTTEDDATNDQYSNAYLKCGLY